MVVWCMSTHVIYRRSHYHTVYTASKISDDVQRYWSKHALMALIITALLTAQCYCGISLWQCLFNSCNSYNNNKLNNNNITAILDLAMSATRPLKCHAVIWRNGSGFRANRGPWLEDKQASTSRRPEPGHRRCFRHSQWPWKRRLFSTPTVFDNTP